MATTEGSGQSLVLTPYGGCVVAGRVSGGEDVRLPSIEHCGTMYYDYSHYGPVSCVKADTRAKGGNAVAGTVLSGFGWDADGGLRGGAERGGGVLS